MKEFLSLNRKAFVFVLKSALYVLITLVFVLVLAVNSPQLLRISRTSIITILFYVISFLFVVRIYGTFNLGVRKSKPIILSITLSAFIADIMGFVVLVIMNTNEITSNNIYPYFVEDILWLTFGFLVQIAIVVLFTYLGHLAYFSFVPAEKCLIITTENDNGDHLKKGISKYKMQYSVGETVLYTVEDLYDKIMAHDSIFLNDIPHNETNDILSFCYKNHKKVYRTLNIPDLITNTSQIIVLGDESILVSPVKDKLMSQRIIKRLGDIFISALGLIVTSPLLLISAIAIKLDDKGHILFAQNRVTIGGKFFTLYKLRTMKEDADDTMVKDDDDRITKVGRLLRKLRIDEIPQFFNVLKGDMSVVGPRAEMADRVYVNCQDIPEYYYRYRMKAGITGYAQINGKYNTSAKDKLMLDLTYIQTFSIWNDVRIIFQTIMVVLRPDKSTEAYRQEDEDRQKKLKEEVDEKAKQGELNE